MARVEIKGLAVGVIQDRHGDVQADLAFTCDGTVYSAATTGATLTGSQLKTNSDGELPGWLEPGVYTITVPRESPLLDKVVTFEVGGAAGGLEPRVDALESPVGLSDKFVQATAGTRTNTAYGALSNGPDQVVGLVLPADALIVVSYNAIWRETVNQAARAAIFIGANQLKENPTTGGSPEVQEAVMWSNSSTDYDTPLYTEPGGLEAGGPNVPYTGDVATGQMAGLCAIRGLPAGTYTISVRFKASSGTVTVKDRTLRARVEAY